MALKQFAISMVLSAVDKVTAPINGIVKNVQGASSRMTRAIENASVKIGRQRMGEEGRGGMFGEMFKAEVAVDVIKDVGEKVIEFGKTCVEANDEASISAQRLQTLMRNVKGTTIEQVGAVSELAEKTSMHTVAEASALKYGQSQLASYQMNAAQIKKLTPALADLATAEYGVNANSEQFYAAANQMGKVFVGETGALKRAGISFTAVEEKIMKSGTAAQKTAELVKVLKENYGGLAESLTKTGKGAAAQAEHAFKLVQEKIGAALEPIRTEFWKTIGSITPGLEALAKKLPAAVKKGTGVFDKDILPIFKNMGKTIAPAFKEFQNPAVTNALKQMGAVVMRVLPVAGRLLSLVIKTALVVIARAIPTLVPMVKKVGDFLVIAGNAAIWLWTKALDPLFKWLASWAIPWIIRLNFGWVAVAESLDFLGRKVASFWNGSLLPFFRNVGAFFKNTFGAAKQIFEAFASWLVDRWRSVVSFFQPTLGSISGAIRGIGSFLGFKTSLSISGGAASPMPSAAEVRPLAPLPFPRAQQIQVDFKNLPKGARVSSSNAAPNVNLSMGYNSLLPR
jgi:hypothetical protein